MPLYTYHCATCNKTQYAIRTILQRAETPSCGCDDPQVSKLLDAPRVVNDYAPYDCPITGKRIEGRRAHIENLKQHGCRVYEPGETQGHAADRAKANVDFENSIAETAAELVAGMPSEKLQQFEQELSSGADLSIDRL